MTQTVILRSPVQRALAKQMVDRCPPDAVVTFSEAKRTLDQNALMWVLLSDIARARPEGRAMPPEMWKAAFLSALGHEIVWQPGLEGAPAFPAGFRSSRLSKAQMAELITFIQAYGDRHRVAWSEPQERKSA